MSSTLLRKAIDKAEARDNALKWSLLERVNDCVKELQLKCTSERTNALNNDEATNSFLWVMEGIFIQGLNNSFLKSSGVSSFSSLLSSFSGVSLGASSSTRDASPAVPNPSFWEFVLVFLHRDLIDKINSLHLIHTDVGRCRAWLRVALNEGLLQSFLDNMTLKSNRRCLRAFYKSSAFLRDSEKCDILKNYLMGIELLDFRLVINNSFLNHWNSGPLSLVGLWVDENESIQQGVDVASNIESKEFQAIPKLQQRQNNSQTPPRFYSELDSVLRRQQPPPLLSENDALRIILSSSPRPAPQAPPIQPIKTSPTPPTLPSSKERGQASSSKKNADTTEDLPEIAEEAGMDCVEGVDKSSSKSKDEGKSSMLTHHVISSPVLSVAKVEDTNRTTTGDMSEFQREEEPGLLQLELSSPVHVITSSPVNCQNTPKHLSTSVSSIELESPVNDERSYADMLLKYQQRNQSNKSLPEEHVENYSTINHANSIASSNELIVNSTGGRSGKSSTGSMNTTTTSGVSSKVSKFTRRKVSRPLVLAAEERIELLRSSPHLTKENIMELLPRISKYTKILANEAGLDSQNYSCKMCTSSIGMIYGPARLCNFTGALYCTICHLNQEKVIPSRILLNWDFGVYHVCKQAYDFLEELKDEAIFDIQEINPILYTEVDECGQVKKLRTKLFYIGMYLKTCKNTKALDELKSELEASRKEHLIDSIHSYTLSDLLGIPSRTLANLLTKLVSTGSGHILSCTICREKGFICEVCKKPQVVFPFELERIFKCGDCGAVYHNTCMDHSKKCPRCERWKKSKEQDDEELDCDANAGQNA